MPITEDQINQLEQDRFVVDNLTSQLTADSRLAWRMRTIAKMNPYMANNPDAILKMAQMPISNNELFDQAGAIYGLQAANTIQSELANYSPSVQRSIYYTLSPAQQQLLGKVGYKTPDSDLHDDGFGLGSILGFVGEATAPIRKGVGALVMPVARPLLGGLAEVSDTLLGQPYRTIRQLGTDTQIVGLIGAGLAVAGVVATGGAGALALGGLAALGTTTATAGTLGFAALGGAVASSFLYETAKLNPDQWISAWKRADDGERLFRQQSVNRAQEILGDPTLVALAKTISLETSDAVSLIELAQDVAGNRGSTSQDVQLKELEQVALRFAEANTEQFRTIYSSLVEIVNQPLFQEAIKTLEQGKISIGRDVARFLTPFDEDSAAYRWISGGIDAATAIAIDPFLLAGKLAKGWQFARRGIQYVDGANAARRYREIAQLPEVARVNQLVADAVNAGDIRILERYAPWMKNVYDDLVAHKRLLEDIEDVDILTGKVNYVAGIKGPRTFTGEDVTEWVAGHNQLRSIMQGIGVVPGTSFGTLKGLNRSQYAMKTATGNLKAFFQGASDLRLESLLTKISKDPEALKALFNGLPDAWRENIDLADNFDEDTVRNVIYSLRGAPGEGGTSTAYLAGRRAGDLFIGLKTIATMVDTMNLMVPGKGFIMLSGPDAVDDVSKFVDLFRTAAVPSFVRDIWKRAILESPEVGPRMNAIASMIDSFGTAVGMRGSENGAELLDDAVLKIKQHYSVGATGRLIPPGLSDEVPVGTLPIAHATDAMPIPDLQAIRNAVKQGSLLRVIAGIPEGTAIAAFQNKFWKPSVLLRFGFAVRNISEDLISWLSRAGIGHITQEMAGRNIAKNQFYNESLYKAALRERAYLTPQERYALENLYDIPAHVRPIARLASHFEHGSVALDYLKTYGENLANVLRNGFGPEQYKRWVQGIEDLDISAATVGLSPNIWRANANLIKKSLFLGNRYSVRRMIAGGVHDDIIDAALAWERQFAANVMRGVGATSTLPWQRDIDNSELIETTSGGTYEVVQIRGERALTYAGREARPGSKVFVQDFHHAYLNNLQQAVNDDPLGAMIAANVLRTIDPTLARELDPETLLNIVSDWKSLFSGINPKNKDAGDLVQLYFVLNERRPSIDRVMALVDSMKEGRNAGLALDIENILRPAGTPPTWDEIRTLPSYTYVQQNVTNVDAFQILHEQISQLDAGIQQWVRANLYYDFAMGGQHLDPAAINAWRIDFKTGFTDANNNRFGPFFTNVETALANGQQEVLTAIQSGAFDDVLNKNRSWVPSAPGTKSHVIKFNAPSQVQGVDTQITDEWLASSFGIAGAGTGQFRYSDFEEIASAINQARNTGQPFVIVGLTDSQAKKLWSDLTFAERQLGNRALPPIEATYLPITPTFAGEPFESGMFKELDELATKLNEVYPVVASKWNGALIGRNQAISTIVWDENIYPLVSEYLSEVARLDPNAAIAERLTETIRQRTKGGRRTQIVVRDNKTVYINVNGKAEAIGPGQEVSATRKLYSDQNLKDEIAFGDQRYMLTTEVSYGLNDDVVWSVLAPVMYDKAEALAGRRLYVNKNSERFVLTPRQRKMLSTEEATIQMGTDRVPLNVATVEDVLETPAGMLPDYDISLLYKPKFSGNWDRAVQYGFNKVLSPMIDAFARRPMGFHSFMLAYTRNMENVAWLYKGSAEEKELLKIVSDREMAKQFNVVKGTALKGQRLAESGRLLGIADGVEDASLWTDLQAITYLRGHGEDDLKFAVRRASLIFKAQPELAPANSKALLSFIEREAPNIKSIYVDNQDPWDFVAYVDSILGEGAALAGKPVQRMMEPGVISFADEQQMRKLNEFLEKEGRWAKVQRAAKLKENAAVQAGQYASEHAIRDIMPYIDSHELRSQFSDWGRGFLPFWYAEENFLKRWARNFTLDGPLGTLALARKLQLTANGLRTMGVVRTDSQGKQYFVYPGSDLLIDAVSKIPFIGENMLPISSMLQTDVQRMIPGFNPQFGAPSFSPVIGFPVELMQSIFPESQSILDFQQVISGPMSTKSSVLNYIVPSSIKNTFEAGMAVLDPNSAVNNERVASAMMAAIAHLEATGEQSETNPNGRALRANATASEVDDYLRRARDHARIIVLSQALAGWFTPGPASAFQQPTGNSIEWISNGQFSDPQDLLSSTYFDLIKNLGIEEGTQRYLEMYPDNRIKNVVSPLAYTVGKTQTASGAPLPSTDESVQFYADNRDLLDQYKFAGAWLLPVADESDERTQYAYDSEVIAGLRERKTPDEFLREIKFREGANIYFKSRKDYLDEYERLRANGNDRAARVLKDRYNVWAQIYLKTHPVFEEELTSQNARDRRQSTITEMRLLLNDPEVPKAKHFDALKTLMDSFDSYTVELSRLALDRSSVGRARTEVFKKRFDGWVTTFVAANPQVNTFWLTVLRPETGLD